MGNVASVRLAAPKASAGEIVRKELINAILGSNKKLTYIHAGAGYGKTTLLSQIASSRENTVWISFDGESDVFAFAITLCAAVRLRFPDFDFTTSEYLPFERKVNFITILANALISAVEKLAKDFIIIMDDLHTMEEPQIKKLIACIVKYKPENIQLCLSGRESPWKELVPQRVRGNILELTQKELKFTRNEVMQILGFDDENIYGITEGWPLAIGSFKILLENGVSLVDIPGQGNEALHSYLLYECISRLPSEIVDFLRTTACFEELDAQMIDAVLDKRNSKLLFESLVSRNIFTIRTDNGLYRYHSLFREYLLEGTEDLQRFLLLNKAASFYYDKKQYSKAAEYAIISKNAEMLRQIILTSYKNHIKCGNFSELRLWFQALNDANALISHEILVAKGAFLSSTGNFSDANTCLDTVIPLLSADDQELYIEAMIHKARVLRNFTSFEESNKLLDELLLSTDNLASDMLYAVAIEKIYNLCWTSQIREAYAATYHMILTCAKAGDVQVKAWFERYLTTIHFFAGRMKESVYCYEKSLELPENDQKYLDIHNVGIYAAKAYQILGDQSKAVSIISTEIQKLRSTGRYEEMWAAYLLAAEIHYHIAYVDRMNGGSQTYETAIKYFTLADEYAPLYRATEFQMLWAKIQRLICSLIFLNDAKEPIITEILANFDKINDYLKTIVLGRLFSYYAAVSDFPSAVKYAKLSIKIGEESNIMIIPTIAYGVLARAFITMQDHDQAVWLTQRYLQLCSENGIYDFFRMRKAYAPILEFALDNGIEPDFAEQMMALTGYKTKKVYIKTLGGFSVFPYKNRQNPLKMRTKKERELLAFLIDAGNEGVTKEQIYNAIWSESESNDIKKLIGVNLSHIKKDLSSLGVENPIINNEKHYSICMDEIQCDIELFQSAVEEFKLQHSNEAAQKILSLYKGEYLSDFEALWAIGKRIRCREAYELALNHSVKKNNLHTNL
ncbi:MAG: hypothetical protein VR68_03145 [Peptococcaceae bacterium BRH_c4a]|nr:MAG: hypothetical protein VR68_03145 [Peptococcaceae bacterium BRH_c4a]